MFIVAVQKTELCHILNQISSIHNLAANSSRNYSKIVIKIFSGNILQICRSTLMQPITRSHRTRTKYYLLTYLLTYSMQQGPSWEAN